MYNYYLGFLALVQIAVALNFGFLILEKKSLLNQFQKGFFDWIKNLFKKEIEVAQYTYSRVRDQHMPKEFVDKKEELQGLLAVFDPDAEYKAVSLFMPGFGFIAGLYSLLFLLIIPLWTKGDPIVAIDIFELLTEATLLAISMMFLTLYFKGSFRNPYTCICLSLLWLIIFSIIVLVLYALKWTWGILQIEWFFFVAIVIPYIPIIIYICRLVWRAWCRYKKIDTIVSKTKKLADELNAYRDNNYNKRLQ